MMNRLLKALFLIVLITKPLHLYFAEENDALSEAEYTKDYDEEGYELDATEVEAVQRLIINGFMTAGYIRSDTEIDYSPRIGLAVRYDLDDRYDNRGSEDTLTKYGLSFTYLFDEDTKFFSQVLSRARDESRYSVFTDWAFVERSISSKLRIRAGLVRLPGGLYAQNSEIGYTYHWVELPNEVYTTKIVNSFSGIDLLFNYEFGEESALEIEIYGGRTQQEFQTKTETIERLVIENLMGMDFNIYSGAHTLNVNYSSFDITLEYDESGLSASEAKEKALENDDFSFDKTKFRGGNISYLFDEDFLFGAEYYYYDLNGDQGLEYVSNSYYVTSGFYLFPYLMLHATYSYYDLEVRRNPFEINTTFNGVDVVLKDSDSEEEQNVFQRTRQITKTLGIRYDLTPYSAVKFNYSIITVPYLNSKVGTYNVFLENGLLLQQQDIFIGDDFDTQNHGFFEERPNRDINVYKASYDIVF